MTAIFMIAHIRTAHKLANCIFFSKMGPLIGKNSQLRSRSLDSLTACKFSSHSSEHRRRSYEFCRSACMARKNNHCPNGLLKSAMQNLASTMASHRSQRPIVHAFLQERTLFKSGSTLSDVHERLARMAQSALCACAAVTASQETT